LRREDVIFKCILYFTATYRLEAQQEQMTMTSQTCEIVCSTVPPYVQILFEHCGFSCQTSWRLT